jgi:hypothetical protein
MTEGVMVWRGKVYGSAAVHAHKTSISCANVSSKYIKKPCIHLVY